MYTNVDVFINNKIIASVTCNVFLLYFNEKGITLLMQSVLLLLLLWYTGNERTTNPFELAYTLNCGLIMSVLFLFSF